MEGIPGEVGGGLRMNAGAMGSETFQRGERPLSRSEGEPHTKTPAELEVHYRHVPSLEHNYAVSAVFAGTPASRRRLFGASMSRRRTPHHATRREERRLYLQESRPMPGGKIGGRTGLEKHQRRQSTRVESARKLHRQRGGATASEVLELIERIQHAAREKRGIELETEVQIVGEPG